LLRNSVYQKQQTKSAQPEKQLVVSQKQSVVYTSKQQLKTEFKELEIERLYICLYWFTPNPELHPVFSEL